MTNKVTTEGQIGELTDGLTDKPTDGLTDELKDVKTYGQTKQFRENAQL